MGVLELTGHPIQRTGAWAVAVLAGRDHPRDVDEGDLAAVRDGIVADLKTAANAAKDSTEYGWWKVLFALYPNAAPTHASRAKWTDLDDRIEAIFASDEDLPGRTCVFCDLPAVVVWAKTYLPMFDTTKALNTLPPAGDGWPVCRGCRIAMWALPYGALAGAGSTAVLTGGSDELQRRFVEHNVRGAKKVQRRGLDGIVRGSAARLVVSKLFEVEELVEPITLWTFKNDNQEPWMSTVQGRTPLVRFVRELENERQALLGWKMLANELTVRKRTGEVERYGSDRAAEALFEPTGKPQPHSRFLDTVYRRLSAGVEQKHPRTIDSLHALAYLYVREVLYMDPERLRPVAELVASWIAAGGAKGAGTNQRGRFNEYAKVALVPGDLGRKLVEAQTRLTLDGHPISMQANDATDLICSGPESGQKRMLLFFLVIEELQKLDVKIGNKDKEQPPDDVETTVHAIRSGEGMMGGDS